MRTKRGDRAATVAGTVDCVDTPPETSSEGKLKRNKTARGEDKRRERERERETAGHKSANTQIGISNAGLTLADDEERARDIC